MWVGSAGTQLDRRVLYAHRGLPMRVPGYCGTARGELAITPLRGRRLRRLALYGATSGVFAPVAGQSHSFPYRLSIILMSAADIVVARVALH